MVFTVYNKISGGVHVHFYFGQNERFLKVIILVPRALSCFLIKWQSAAKAQRRHKSKQENSSGIEVAKIPLIPK